MITGRTRLNDTKANLCFWKCLKNISCSFILGQFYTTCLNIIFVGIRLGWTFKTLNLLGWIPTVAPLRSSTSPPPPLAYFKHINLSVPKIKMESEMPNAKNQTLFCLCRQAEAHGVEYCEKTPPYSFLLIEV